MWSLGLSCALLFAQPAVFPARFGVKRIALDAGHGYGANHGNTSCRCEPEEAFTWRAAQELSKRLEATHHFAVRMSRVDKAQVSYERRVAEAAAWKADAFLSLHSDARGWARPVAMKGGVLCYGNADAPGFAILWADNVGEPLAGRRVGLARALARWMSADGFLAYDGADYPGLYDPDDFEPGVFVDRHVPRQRIYVLNRTRMPAVIIETHHALDRAEVERWDRPETYDAFADAVAQALIDALR